jgi:phenylalanyl-tRNA synthetase alpha subunit
VDSWILDAPSKKKIIPLANDRECTQEATTSNLVSHERLRSYETQLGVLNDSLNMIEQTLSNEASKQCQVQLNENLLNNLLQSEGKIAFSSTEHTRIFPVSQEITSKFPFYQILQAWRQQFLQLKFQNILLARQIKDLYYRKGWTE